MDRGLVDPAMVTRLALQIAASESVSLLDSKLGSV
jgi:hypothetical protein